MNVQLVKTYEDFTKLEPRWSEIAKAGGGQTPFQSFAWNDQWLRHRGEGVEPFTLVLQDGATIAPFGRWRISGIRILRLLGTGDSDYPGLVTSLPAHEAWDSVAQQLAKYRDAWDLLHLHSVPDQEAIVSALARHIGSYPRVRQYEVCPWVSTNLSWEALLAKRKTLRELIKRKARKLEKMGDTSVEIIRPPVRETLIRELIEVEQASWKWDLGNAAFMPGSGRDFLQAVLRDPRMEAQLWLLRLCGKLVAFVLMLTAHKRWYYYLPVFRQDCSNAGNYLLARIIEAACSSDCECVDLLRGDHAYKYAWTSLINRVYEIVCPSNLRGHFMELGYRARWYAAKSLWIRRLRTLLTRKGDRR